MVDGNLPWSPKKAAEAIPGAQYKHTGLAGLHIAGALKRQPRQGWVRVGVSEVESVADHSWRMALMAMVLEKPDPTINRDKCIQMCLIHDMAESLVGDITPFDGIDRIEKQKRESASMELISGFLGGSLSALWQEYEEGKTPEAVWCHDLDKQELLLQMVEYEKQGQGDLGDFAYVAKKLKLPSSVTIASEILEEREKFWDGKEHKRGEDGARASDVRKQQDAYYQQ